MQTTRCQHHLRTRRCQANTGTKTPTKATKAEVRGKLERTLGQLGIEYSELLRGEQRNTARLFKVFQRDPQNRHLLAFLKTLDDFNQQGTNKTDKASLEARLTPLLT